VKRRDILFCAAIVLAVTAANSPRHLRSTLRQHGSYQFIAPALACCGKPNGSRTPPVR